MRPWLYHYQIQWLYYLSMTLSVSQAKKSFLITNINRTQNIDTFTVQSDRNFTCFCEYFGGQSIFGWIRDDRFVCVCRCDALKPRFSFGKEYPQCVEIESSPEDDVDGYLKGQFVIFLFYIVLLISLKLLLLFIYTHSFLFS